MTAAGEVSLDMSELIAAFRDQQHDGDMAPDERRDAIACYLSRAEGWRDALARLGGAFSGTPARNAANEKKK